MFVKTFRPAFENIFPTDGQAEAGAIVQAYESLTVDQSAGTIDTLVKDDTEFEGVGKFDYDVKCVLDDSSSRLLGDIAKFTIRDVPTREI